VKDKIDSILGEGGACDLVILGGPLHGKRQNQKKGAKDGKYRQEMKLRVPSPGHNCHFLHINVKVPSLFEPP
jgi:hypothetical protein